MMLSLKINFVPQRFTSLLEKGMAKLSWTTNVILKCSQMPFHLCAVCRADNDSLTCGMKERRTFARVPLKMTHCLKDVACTFLLSAAGARSL